MNKTSEKNKNIENIEDFDITLVSECLPVGCGLETYYSNLVNGLKSKGINIKPVSIKKLFGNYPFSLTSKIKTKIVHFTDQKSASILFFSPFRKYKSIITIHDLIEIENFNNVCKLDTVWKKIIHKIWSSIVKRGIIKADALIAVSEYTKKDIKKYLGYKKQICVTYEAGEVRSTNSRSNKFKRNDYSVLYIGSHLAHKNLITLIKAFSSVVKKLPQAQLILVGKSLQNNKSLKKLIHDLDLEKNIVFKGYLKDTSKEYSTASVFVFPSLYEGFGLPVLEAMTQGCPVICSNKTSLPEVAGDAAIYFDGYDANDLAQKMYKVLKNKEIQKKMSKNSIKQADKFSWDKCSEQTINSYNNLS